MLRRYSEASSFWHSGCSWVGTHAQRTRALVLTLSFEETDMKSSQRQGFHAHRAADRRGDHRHHRGDRGARSASRPHVGQRGVGDRIAARHQQRPGELLVELRGRRLRDRRWRTWSKAPSRQAPGLHQPRPAAPTTSIKSGYMVTLAAGRRCRRPSARRRRTCNASAAAAMSSVLRRPRIRSRLGGTGTRYFATDTRGTIFFSDTAAALRRPDSGRHDRAGPVARGYAATDLARWRLAPW